jgi:hypothetical protein
MQLTKEQIQQISNFLDAIAIDYEDLKPEILDHMISDIENMMQENNYDFHTAFTIEKIKWNTNFRDATSYYIGRFFTAPKIVIDKANSIFKYFYFGYLLAYFIPMILFKIYNLTIPVFLQNTLLVFTILSFLLGLFVFFKIYTSKRKTVYSFIIKTQVFYLLFPLITGFFYLYSKPLHHIYISFSLVSIYAGFVIYYFYSKHKRAIKKLKATKIT